MEFTFSPLLGIAGAAVLGGLVGVQRQAAAKPAGLRTHLIVACASAAFTAMGAHLHDTRIPSYVVVGIGFLGAGAIVRDGPTARGLTTAASIWMAAAIGLLMGYSDSFGLSAALVVTAITILALILSDTALMGLLHVRRKASIKITCSAPGTVAVAIANLLRAAHINFETADVLSITSDREGESGELLFWVALRPGENLNRVLHDVSAIDGVRRVDANEPFFMG